MKACRIFFDWGTALILAAAAATAALASGACAEAPRRQTLSCTAPADLIRLDNPLKRVAQRIAAGQPITIVAIGSSSTAGAGASSPAMTYPSRLEVELKALFPRARHHGRQSRRRRRDHGARCWRGSIATCSRENPDLVLWQVGSNSVLRDQPLGEVERARCAKASSGCRRPTPTWS